MRTELILDEEGLRIALQYYLEKMSSTFVGGNEMRPVNPRLITKVEIQPRVKRVKVIYEFRGPDE